MNLREHLLERHLDPSAYSVFLDDEGGMATFLLFDLSGRVVGYQQYRPNAPKMLKNDPREGRYYTYVTGKKEERQIALWGFESWDFSPGLLFLTEGIFKSSMFHAAGYSSLATLSNNPKFIKEWLSLISGQRKIVMVGDNDGKTHSLGFPIIYPPKHVKDVDELSPHEFRDWLNSFSFLT